MCPNCDLPMHSGPCNPQDERLSTWECIMTDPSDGTTMVIFHRCQYWQEAVDVFETTTDVGGLWDGWIPFVPSVLSD